MIPELRRQVRDAVRPLAAKYGLSTLPEFADIIVIAWLFFTTLQLSLSPAISKAVFPISYGKTDKRTRKNWDTHVVSFVHAIVAVILGSRCLLADSLNKDRAFGTNADAGFLLAIAIGYFIWDILESIVHFSDFGFVVHALACLAIFTLTTRPFLQYFAVRFLLWEVSTIFLNINWFLDKMGRSGSRLQLVNGVVLLASFFCFRLIWGGKLSYDFFVTLNDVYTRLPLFYILVYGVGNVMLQGLNWLWFIKMIGAVRKRFPARSIEGKPNGHGMLDKYGAGKIKSRLD